MSLRSCMLKQNNTTHLAVTSSSVSAVAQEDLGMSIREGACRAASAAGGGKGQCWAWAVVLPSCRLAHELLCPSPVVIMLQSTPSIRRPRGLSIATRKAIKQLLINTGGS
jgi:hypothetical protein